MTENKEKLNAYLCDRRIEEFNLLNGKCLEIGFYSPNRVIAWLHDQRIFEISWTTRKTPEYILTDGRRLEMEYALGGLYYDFVKSLERFDVHI